MNIKIDSLDLFKKANLTSSFPDRYLDNLGVGCPGKPEDHARAFENGYRILHLAYALSSQMGERINISFLFLLFFLTTKTTITTYDYYDDDDETRFSKFGKDARDLNYYRNIGHCQYHQPEVSLYWNPCVLMKPLLTIATRTPSHARAHTRISIYKIYVI